MGRKVDLRSALKSCAVSSVQNRDVKQFSKKHLFDDDLETCWSSDQGSPQWIRLSFKDETALCALALQFQGGFVGSDCSICCGEEEVVPFYPEDNNSVQTFSLPENFRGTDFKIVFNASTDFFGRIVLYGLWLETCESSCKHAK
uniref:Nuclear receptor 2C2-associated protein n=1 Tax=Lygus hesperus TaxID=30085 RepID=A0A146M8F9_LYGHE